MSFRAPDHILEAALLHGPPRGRRRALRVARRPPAGAPLGCAEWPLPGRPRPRAGSSSAQRKVFCVAAKLDSEKAAAEAAGVRAAMEEPPVREGDEEDEEEADEAGPEGALGKSPFQLTAEDVYDISYVVGRELMALGSDPRVTRLQFKIVRVLEMLETLVSEGGLAAEELRLERDSLRREVDALRSARSAASAEEVSARRAGGGDPGPSWQLTFTEHFLGAGPRVACVLSQWHPGF